MIAQILITFSAGILMLLGAAHLALTFVGDKLHPRDAELMARLKTTSPVLTRQTTVWNAWIGFNASHSMGAILFGAIFAYLALRQPNVLFHSRFLCFVGFVTLAAYLVLAKRYWFARPLQGISLALVAYIAGFVLAHWPVFA